jgi:uncharacterized integral membrane protein
MIGVIVVLQNTEPVETRILFVTLSIPGAMLLLGTMIVGFLVGMFATSLLLRTGINTRSGLGS